MNHNISRSDRNRVRRAREDDRPRNWKALSSWVSRCTSKAFPGQAFVPFDYMMKLVYQPRDVGRIRYRRFRDRDLKSDNMEKP